MRTAELHTAAPQPPSEALVAYRRGMRAQMRVVRAATRGSAVRRRWGVEGFPALVARARDVPDGIRRMLLEQATRLPSYLSSLPVEIQNYERVKCACARECLALIDAYHATLPHKPPWRQPDCDEPAATYARPRTEMKRARSRAHRRRLRRRHIPTPPAAPPPRPPPVMSRTRAARVQPPPIDPAAE